MTYKQTRLLLVDFRLRNGTQFLSLWSRACLAQGWDRNDRKFRTQKFSQLLGRTITSANDITDNREVDRLFAALKALNDDLAAARETADAQIGEARRLRWKIAQVKNQLAELVTDVDAYTAALIRDEFNHGISRRVELLTELDLNAAQLRRLLVTLTRCLSEKKARSEAALILA